MAQAADGGDDPTVVDRRAVAQQLRDLAAGVVGGVVGDKATGIVDGVVGRTADGHAIAGTSVYLDGPPGIGKSFLIEQVLKELPDSVAVLRAAGDYRRRHDPFTAIEQLTGTAPVGLDPSDVAFDRVDALCAVGPVVLWMDDAHNADAASLTVLRRLIWASRSLPLLVIISARPFPVREQVDMVVRQVRHQLRLPGMDSVAVERLVVDRTGRRPTPRLRASLELAAGNPLFVVEILGALDSLGSLQATGSDDLDVTAGSVVGFTGLETMIREHLGQLDESARDLLAALAVWGTPVEISDLAAVLYSTPDDLMAPLDRAVRAGIVRLGPLDTVDFSHDLYREVLYQELPQAFRRATHLRIAKLLEGSGGGPSLVAEHLLQAAAGRSSPSDPSVLAALNDAVAASRVFAPEVAADLLAEADTVTAGVESETLLYQRIQDLLVAGHGAEADRLIRDRIGGVADRGVAAGMQEMLIRSLVYRAESAGAIAIIDRTTAIPGLPAAALHQLQALRGWVSVLAGQQPSEAENDALMARFVAAGDRSAQATLMVNQACTAHLAGRSGQALDIMRSRSRLVTDDQDWQSRSTSLVWPALFELSSRGPDAGLMAVRRARVLSAERSAHWIDAYLCSIAGGAAMISGDWDDAVAELDTALELALETDTGWVSISVGDRSYIDAHRGDTGTARRRLEEFRYTGRPLQFGQNDPGLAELAVLEAEGSARAAGALARSLWSTARNGSVRWAHHAAPDIVRVALMGSDRRFAEQVSDDLQSRHTPDGDEAVPVLVRGMVDGNPKDIASAASSFEVAGRGALAAMAWEEHACAAASMRANSVQSKQRALESLNKAIVRYERMGAVPDRDRALARLRALGVRRGAREGHRTAESGWASLTATELRIAALVREGLTNREIGTRLFISPRTVQTHVSHILTKTGLRSRVEVAAAADR